MDGWFKFPRQVVECVFPLLSAQEAKVLVVLMAHAPNIFPSQTWIGRLCGVKRQAIILVVAALESAGIIGREKSIRKGGRWLSTTYYLPDFENEEVLAAVVVKLRNRVAQNGHGEMGATVSRRTDTVLTDTVLTDTVMRDTNEKKKEEQEEGEKNEKKKKRNETKQPVSLRRASLVAVGGNPQQPQQESPCPPTANPPEGGGAFGAVREGMEDQGSPADPLTLPSAALVGTEAAVEAVLAGWEQAGLPTGARSRADLGNLLVPFLTETGLGADEFISFFREQVQPRLADSGFFAHKGTRTPLGPGWLFKRSKNDPNSPLKKSS